MLRSLILAVLLAIGGCATLPVDYERTETAALQDTESTALGKDAQTAMKQHEGLNGFRPIPDGVDAMLMRLSLARSAERSLDMMYYIWKPDLVGRLLGAAVLRAADRGVRVRILLDDLGTNADDNVLMSLDAHPEIEIRLFNPVASRAFRMLGALGDFGRVNRRMHNKAFIADNQRAVLGGRNIGDEYFGAHAEMDYGDLDVAITGPVVNKISSSFDEYWNSPVVYPIKALTGRGGDNVSLDTLRSQLEAYVESERDSPYAQALRSEAGVAEIGRLDKLYWGQAHLVYDDPAKVTRDSTVTEGRLLPQLEALGLAPKKEIFIVSPYFVPGDAGVAWLAGLAGKGVRVTVLTNSLASNDVTAVHSGYKRYRDALVDGGVRLYELRPEAIKYKRKDDREHSLQGSRASLHAKTFVFDRRAIFIGSMNLDPRSIALNTEIGVVCDNPAMSETLLGRVEPRLDEIAWRLERDTDETGRKRLVWVEKDKNGVRRLTAEPQVSAWRQLGVWFLGVLPIESQL
jgi:putative cardiolipin synthase